MPMDPLKIGADLSSLAETPASTDASGRLFAAYLRGLLNAVAVFVYEPGAGAKIRLLEEDWKEGVERTPESARQVQELVATRLDAREAFIQEVPGTSGIRTFALCVPVLQDGTLRALLAALLAAESREALSPFLIILQAAGGYLNYRFKRQDRSLESWALEQITALMEIFSLAAARPDFEDAARTLADSLTRHTGCHRVCVGVRKRRTVSLTAVSGADSFDSRGTAALVLQSAMAEAIAKGKLVSWPPDESAGALADPAHYELGRVLDLGKIVTLPLQDRDGTHNAAISFLWQRTSLPDDRTLQFLLSTHPHIALQVDLLRQASPSLARRIRRRAWTRLDREGRRAVLAACGALLLALAWPFHHRIRASARIQPDTKRIVAAPFDGVLRKAFVEPGQKVETGTLLAQMDDKELLWKRAELSASRDRSATESDQTLTDQSVDYAVSRMARYDEESAGTELEAVDEKIKNLEIRAPIPGVVILGDLRRAEGVPVSKGQPLFEVAPLDKMLAEAEIDADDISHVREGMPVRLSLESVPGKDWEGTLSRINPQSEIRGGSNVFIAEVALQDAGEDSGLRPGMRGRAVIIGRTRSLAWILFHRVWEVLDLLLFW